MSTALAFQHHEDPPEPRSTGFALSDHPTQSMTAIDGWKSALFGIPFFAAGLAVTILHHQPTKPTTGPDMPAWSVTIIGGAFLLSGLFFIVHGLHTMIGDWIYRLEAARHPDNAWRYDHRWRLEGSRFSAWDAMLLRLLAALGWYAFLLPFAWVGLEVPNKKLFLVGAIVLGLFGFILVARWLAMFRDYLRYGNSLLRFDAIPYVLGGPLRAHLRAPRHLSELDGLDLTLRCVQERYITSGTGRDRSTSVVCFELYADTTTVPRERLQGIGAEGLPVEFTVPADKPPTTLAVHPPTYWEIEAKGSSAGVDYQAYFLVPVYRKG